MFVIHGVLFWYILYKYCKGIPKLTAVFGNLCCKGLIKYLRFRDHWESEFEYETDHSVFTFPIWDTQILSFNRATYSSWRWSNKSEQVHDPNLHSLHIFIIFCSFTSFSPILGKAIICVIYTHFWSILSHNLDTREKIGKQPFLRWWNQN